MTTVKIIIISQVFFLEISLSINSTTRYLTMKPKQFLFTVIASIKDNSDNCTITIAIAIVISVICLVNFVYLFLYKYLYK